MNKTQEIGALAAKLMQSGMESGLTWDETVAAFGVAAKALAGSAHRDGDGALEDCQDHARKRFEQGFAQEVQVVFAMSDIS